MVTTLIRSALPESPPGGLPFRDYDHIIVALSGGKDSEAVALYMMELVVAHQIPFDRLEFWHHLTDGNEGDRLFDWPITHDYVVKFAQAMDIPLYFVWREGGIKREILRENTRTAPMRYETPGGISSSGGVSGKESTRRMFPAATGDLQRRWCTATAKIDPGRAALCHPRFDGKNILFLTGERREESTKRSSYQEMECHHCDLARKERKRAPKTKLRYVDHWRPVIDWKEGQVWDIIKASRVRPHPCYYLGFSRCSCMTCIFWSYSQAATIKAIAPHTVEKLAAIERDISFTMRDKLSVDAYAALGAVYPAALKDPDMVALALSDRYTLPIIVPADEEWVLPAGAFGEDKAGPT